MDKAILAYVPVLHQGYLNFFTKNSDASALYLVSEEFTQEAKALQKDIRALPAEKMQQAISALGIFEKVKVVGKAELESLAKEEINWIFSDEELMHELAERFFADKSVTFDTTFLRWDRKSILKEQPVQSAKHILPEDFNHIFLDEANDLKEKSADWWRQVGGVIVKEGKILAEAWNHHLPSAQEPYFNGDPRASFHKGDHIELSTAIHSEASLVAQAAKNGSSVDGADLYNTTFPCPVCAKLVAASGIKRVYFSEGYAMLDGETILQASGIEIYKVEE